MYYNSDYDVLAQVVYNDAAYMIEIFVINGNENNVDLYVSDIEDRCDFGFNSSTSTNSNYATGYNNSIHDL